MDFRAEHAAGVVGGLDRVGVVGVEGAEGGAVRAKRLVCQLQLREGHPRAGWGGLGWGRIRAVSFGGSLLPGGAGECDARVLGRLVGRWVGFGWYMGWVLLPVGCGGVRSGRDARVLGRG